MFKAALSLSISFLFLGSVQVCFAVGPPVTPLPQEVKYDKDLALLGKSLFFDSNFSSNKKVSCASCHHMDHGGAEPTRFSTGVNGALGDMNAPTVFNSGFNFAQFWNGRAANLEDQALGPIQNPIEMGMTLKKLESRLNAGEKYKKPFAKVFGDGPITATMFAKAIAEFEKALFTPNAKFDRYLRGEVALSKTEAAGYQLFKSIGCISCHNGRNLGGNSYQKLGVIVPYQNEGNWADRLKVTGKLEDKFRFKVPTLRNIALTEPYFHDGSAKTLETAIILMALHNLGEVLNKTQVANIKAFLVSLTGDTPKILGNQ